MNTLTPSEQEIVNKESKKKFHAYDYLDHRTTYKGGFQEGVEFALQELVKRRMTGFAEWVSRYGIWKAATGGWYQRNRILVADTTEQLYDKYIQEHLKQQEDDANTRTR